MLTIWNKPLGVALALGVAAICSPAWAAPNVPQPGALNYVEGQASIDNQAVTSKSVGTATLNEGDVLSTGNGRAEILLTPGVFMRVGKNSAVRMIAPELTNTRVEVLQGEAMVEADILHKEDHVIVAERGAQAELDKKGVYDFNADAPNVRVYDGKATVMEGDQKVDLGKGREAVLNAPLKSQKFDRSSAEAADPLYSWSKLRSEYLAEATAATAQTYIVDGGGWYGPGWYWNPFWGMYSFVPGAGFFYNPFGWGLYSPVYFYRAPVLYPGFYGQARGGRAVVGGVGNWAARGHAIAPRAAAPAMRSAPMMRSAPAFSRGGFGMGGGFRGGFAGRR
jgi:hypothetical protein